ncbi:MAG: phage head closure protein [bacterium]
MRAGQLDRIIMLRSMTSTTDDYGEQVETWADVGEVWAQKKDLRGGERFAAAQTVGQVDTVFIIRYIDGAGSLNQLIHDDRTYDIKAVLEVGRRKGMELHCRTRGE